MNTKLSKHTRHSLQVLAICTAAAIILASFVPRPFIFDGVVMPSVLIFATAMMGALLFLMAAAPLAILSVRWLHSSDLSSVRTKLNATRIKSTVGGLALCAATPQPTRV